MEDIPAAKDRNIIETHKWVVSDTDQRLTQSMVDIITTCVLRAKGYPRMELKGQWMVMWWNYPHFTPEPNLSTFTDMTYGTVNFGLGFDMIVKKVNLVRKDELPEGVCYLETEEGYFEFKLEKSLNE